jgi:hypothetical protein
MPVCAGAIMLANFLSVWDSLTVTSPFILVCLLLALSCNLTRSTKRDRPGKQRRAKSAFSAAAFSIGIGLQFYDQITRPGVQHQIQQMHEEDADHDKAGDPDDPKAQLNRQLKRIRRGEEIDRLILRLK